MRALIFVLAAFALAGCGDMVTSANPWFDARDEALFTPIPNGVWVSNQTECAFDAAKPVKAWPDCAEAFYVRDMRLFEVSKDAGVWRWQPSETPLSLVGGPSYILQVESAAADAKSAPSPTPSWLYLGVRPTFDADQDVRAMKLWLVACGPKGADAPLFRGLTRAGENCTADSQAALRAAAAASEALDDTPVEVRWVRDVTRGEGPGD